MMFPNLHGEPFQGAAASLDQIFAVVPRDELMPWLRRLRIKGSRRGERVVFPRAGDLELPPEPDEVRYGFGIWFNGTVAVIVAPATPYERPEGVYWYVQKDAKAWTLSRRRGTRASPPGRQTP